MRGSQSGDGAYPVTLRLIPHKLGDRFLCRLNGGDLPNRRTAMGRKQSAHRVQFSDASQ